MTLALSAASRRIAEQNTRITELESQLVGRQPSPSTPSGMVPVYAKPNAALGHHVIALTSWLHYGLGITIDQIMDIFGYYLQTRLTPAD